MISAIVLSQDNEVLIEDCLKSLNWVNEIIIVDTGSKDKTIDIAAKYPTKVFAAPKGSFSDWRNFGAKVAKGEWLLYIDTDERVTSELKKEIEDILSLKDVGGVEKVAYAIPRRNNLLGRDMRHGGWWPDYVLRLINKKYLVSWQGDLHEQPKVKGEIGKLKSPLYHISHRSLTEMMDKTNTWSDIEAELLYKAGHPPMAWWRFFTVGAREFINRGIIKLGFLDGAIGVIEVFYQIYSRMITYAKLWELQSIKSKK